MRVLAGVFCLLMLLSAAVQLNDPDPLRWIVVYCLGAAASGLYAAGRCPEWLAALSTLAFGLWALWMAPAILGARTESFTQMGMSTVADEEAREALGLLIGALWSAVLWRSLHLRAGPPAQQHRVSEHSSS